MRSVKMSALRGQSGNICADNADRKRPYPEPDDSTQKQKRRLLTSHDDGLSGNKEEGESRRYGESFQFVQRDKYQHRGFTPPSTNLEQSQNLFTPSKPQTSGVLGYGRSVGLSSSHSSIGPTDTSDLSAMSPRNSLQQQLAELRADRSQRYRMEQALRSSPKSAQRHNRKRRLFDPGVDNVLDTDMISPPTKRRVLMNQANEHSPAHKRGANHESDMDTDTCMQSPPTKRRTMDRSAGFNLG